MFHFFTKYSISFTKYSFPIFIPFQISFLLNTFGASSKWISSELKATKNQHQREEDRSFEQNRTHVQFLTNHIIRLLSNQKISGLTVCTLGCSCFCRCRCCYCCDVPFIKYVFVLVYYYTTSVVM